ncbi:MAG: nucleotidyltransferase domain-containing protein [Thaumarchaeota archaeon]|nr:nucleotidyltransferase domain-containing protein [Nitrososphaerota archaeon]
MQFHDYLEQVLGNRVVIGLLRAMIRYPGKIFTIRGLARTASVSVNETALTIHDFEKLGIIKVQPIGRAHQISFNKKNYILNKVIEPIFKAEEKTLEELLKILKKNLDKKVIISAALFGSIVKREEKEDSDIDVLIISNDFDAASEIVSTAIVEVTEMFQTELAPIIFSQKEFVSKKNSNLKRSIIANHIMICGKDLGSMIK